MLGSLGSLDLNSHQAASQSKRASFRRTGLPAIPSGGGGGRPKPATHPDTGAPPCVNSMLGPSKLEGR